MGMRYELAGESCWLPLLGAETYQTWDAVVDTQLSDHLPLVYAVGMSGGDRFLLMGMYNGLVELKDRMCALRFVCLCVGGVVGDSWCGGWCGQGVVSREGRRGAVVSCQER